MKFNLYTSLSSEKTYTHKKKTSCDVSYAQQFACSPMYQYHGEKQGRAQWKLCLQRRRLSRLPQGSHLAQGVIMARAQGTAWNYWMTGKKAQDTVRAIKPSQLLIPSKSSMPRSLELLYVEKC